jgi:histidinol-phosphate/aromatic aminotransferase/cobyric acid decarboxylase-like protein
MGFKGTDSQANFIFVNLQRPAAQFRDACRTAGVMVGRDFPPYEKTHCRISIGTMAEMQRAVDAFKKVLGSTTNTASRGGQ